MSHGMIRFIATLFLACLSLMAQGVEEVIYYQNDALGSPIIATDQEGRVVWRKSYAPYGQPIGQTVPNEPGYTGKFEEPELSLLRTRAAKWRFSKSYTARTYHSSQSSPDRPSDPARASGPC